MDRKPTDPFKANDGPSFDSEPEGNEYEDDQFEESAGELNIISNKEPDLAYEVAQDHQIVEESKTENRKTYPRTSSKTKEASKMLPPLSQLSRRSQDQSVQLSVRSSMKASKSLKKLQLDEPRTLPEKSSPSRNQMRVAKSVKSLPKYVTQ